MNRGRPRRPTGDGSVVREGLGETYADARAKRGWEAHIERIHRPARDFNRGEDRGERRNGTVRKAEKGWLPFCNTKVPRTSLPMTIAQVLVG